MLIDNYNLILNEAVKKYGKENQVMMAIEEMSELIKELSKDYRKYNNRDNIIEEIVDVSITLSQLLLIFNVEKEEYFDKYDEKMKRLSKNVKKENK